MYVEEPEKQNKQRMDCLKLAVHSLFVLAVFDHSPPANGSYTGGRPTFEVCAPMSQGSQEKSPQITAVLRWGEPHRRSAPIQPIIFGQRHTPKSISSNTQASYGCSRSRFETAGTSTVFVSSNCHFLLDTRVGKSIWQGFRLRFVRTSTCFVSDFRR